MAVRVYYRLPQEALDLRMVVFVDEQGFVDDIDAIDKIATHLVMNNDVGEPIATCRVFPTEIEGVYSLGRFCVRRDHRGQRVGETLLTAAEKEVVAQGGTMLTLHSQLHAKGFYEKNGYTAEGEIEYEQGQPHVFMRKELV